MTTFIPAQVISATTTPRATLIVDGVICTSSVQEQIVTVWDTDDQNGGDLSVDPKVKPICLGNDALFHFTDNSQWNCTPPDENDVINDLDRWIQWIYGTGGTDITNAEVDGTVRAYPWAGPIEHVPGPVEAPIAPYNTSLDIYIPDYYPVGSFFEVTLRNWNTCNPYDDPLIPGTPKDPINGDYPPVTTTAMALIVDIPDATIQPVAAVCESEDPFLLVAADGGGQWAGPGISSPGNAMFDPKLAGPGTHTVTYSITDVNGCSDLGTVLIEVLPAPTTAISTFQTINLCPGILLELDGNPQGGLAPYSHSWRGDTSPLNQTDIQNPDFLSTTVGQYELIYKVEDKNSCWAEDTVIVDVEEVNISLSNSNIKACLGNNIVLDVQPSGGSETFTFHEWTGTRTDKLSATDIQTPTFTADEAGTFIFNYKVKDSLGCEGSETITITVHDQPNSDAGTDITECGLQSALGASPSIGNGVWKVLSGPGSLSFNSFDIPSPNIVSDAYGTYRLRWIEDNNSCKDSAELSVTFVEIPSPSVMEDKDTCGLSVRLYATEHIGTGIWKKTEGTGAATFNNENTSTTKVTVDMPGKYKFAWVEDNGNSCIGGDTVEINFFQVPVAQITPPPAIGCTPLAIDFENTSMYADSYYWDFGNGIVSNLENPQQIFTNKTPDPVDYEITLISRTLNGCTDTVKHAVKVAPTPISHFDADVKTGCHPLTSNFTNKSQGGSNYEWTFGDGSPMDTNEGTTHTFYNTETYTQSFEVKLVTENTFGCSDTSSLFTTVYPKQEFGLSASPDSACSPFNTNLLATPGAYKYEWDLGDGNLIPGSNLQNKLFENTGNQKEKHTVKVYTTSFYGCLDTTETTILVLPSPTARFNPNDFSICSPKDVLFNNTSENAIKSYWDFGDGNSNVTDDISDINHTYVNDGAVPLTYRIRLIAENSFGCKDSMDGFTSVNPSVTAAIDGDTTQCSPFEASFTNSSVGANSYFWDYGDGNTSSGVNGQNIFDNDADSQTVYQVTMVASSVYGCSDTATVEVTALPSPDTYFEPNDFSVCSPKTVEFTNLTENITSSVWQFGDGKSATTAGNEDVEHTYYNDEFSPKEFKIRLVTENSFGCKDSMDGFTSVNPSVTAAIDGGATQCAPFEASFTNSSVGAMSYLWDYGDGNTSSAIVGQNIFRNETYNPVTYEVTMIASSAYGCSDTATVEVTALPSPDTYFEPNDFTVCSPKIVEFTNFTENIVSSVWKFGDGSTTTTEGNESVEHTYHNDNYTPMDFKITLITENNFGCKDSMDGYTSVKPNVVAQITGEGQACSPVEINFGNESAGANSFIWNYGDGNTSSGYLGLNTFTNESTEDKTYEVSMIAKSPYGCSDTAYTQVTVYATPLANFTVSPETMQMPASTVNISNLTIGDNWKYEWDFGDGNTTSGRYVQQHTYDDFGAYTISLKAFSDRCESKSEKKIVIIAGIPVVEYGPPSQGCPALKVDFYSTTTNAETYLWEFGDGNISTEPNPTHTYYTEGTYNVKLTVQGPGGITVKDDLEIEVYPEPTALFDVFPNVITVPGEVAMGNKSIGADSYLWDFGDGNTSTETSPVHEYNVAGNFTVSLEAENEYGCTNTYVQNEAVTAQEGGKIKFPNAFTPNPGGENDGTYNRTDNNNYIFYPGIQDGIEEYQLQIYSRWGQLLFESNDIKVGWNGYYKGRLCSQGVYIWKATCRFSTGQTKVYTGDVTLLR